MRDSITLCIMIIGVIGLFLNLTSWSCYFCYDAEVLNPIQQWIGFAMMLPVVFWFMSLIGENSKKDKGALKV